MSMTAQENYLISLLGSLSDKNAKAMLLQSYIQTYGGVSDEAGERIKQIMQGGVK